MKINIVFVLLIGFIVFAEATQARQPRLYSGNQQIVTFLLTRHEALADPDCLLQFIDFTQHQVFMAAGGSIDSVEVKTVTDERGRDAWHVKLIYDLGAYQQMVCQLR